MPAMQHYHKNNNNTQTERGIWIRHESVYWINLGVLGKLSTEQIASGSIKSWTLASAELLKAVIGSTEESNPQRA